MAYSLPTPSTLDDIFKMNPMAFSQAQEFMQGGVQQNEADLRKQQLANIFDEQNDPLRVQHQRGLNNAQDAMLPGLYADSSMKQRKNTNEASMNDDAIKEAKLKFLQNASDHDIKMLENEGQKMSYSLDPKIRAQGLNILSMHKDIIKEREKDFSKTEGKLREIQETGTQQRLLQSEGIAGGRYARGSGASKGEASIKDGVLSGKLNFEKAAVAYRVLAEDAEDEAVKQRYSQLADQYEVAAQKQKQAAGQGIQRPDLPGLNIPAVGGQPPGPSFGGAVAPSNAPPVASKPVTEAEYNSLPSGAMYLHPDGKMKRKK